VHWTGERSNSAPDAGRCARCAKKNRIRSCQARQASDSVRRIVRIILDQTIVDLSSISTILSHYEQATNHPLDDMVAFPACPSRWRRRGSDARATPVRARYDIRARRRRRRGPSAFDCGSRVAVPCCLFIAPFPRVPGLRRRCASRRIRIAPHQTPAQTLTRNWNASTARLSTNSGLAATMGGSRVRASITDSVHWRIPQGIRPT